MQEKLLKQTAFFTLLFTIAAAGLMVWFQKNREALVRLDDIMVQSPQSVYYEEVVSLDTASGSITLNVKPSDAANVVTLDFDTDVPTQIEPIYDYANQVVSLFFPQATADTFRNCQICADAQRVDCEAVHAWKQTRNGIPGIVLSLPTEGYYEGELSIEGMQVRLGLTPVLPSKEITVVLDAGHGGLDSGDVFEEITEKELNFKIMNMVREQLQKEDIRVYCTRNSDSTVSEQERIAFANAIRADIFVSVQYSFLQDETDKKNGLTAIYNGKFFIPDFGSIELADIMSEETIKKIGGVANGMYETDEDDRLIGGAHVPAALIEIDHVMTQEDKPALISDRNLKRIASGLSAGIIKAKDKLKE